MRQHQAIAIGVEHRDWIVITMGRVIGSAFRHHLVHQRGATGGDAHRHAQRPTGDWPFQLPASVFSRANARCVSACCASVF
jgi:hypothetical protein